MASKDVNNTPASDCIAAAQLTVSIVALSGRGRQVVEARRGEVVYRDTVDLNAAKRRGTFLKSVQEKFQLTDDQVRAMEQDVQTQISGWRQGGDQPAADNAAPHQPPVEREIAPE